MRKNTWKIISLMLCATMIGSGTVMAFAAGDRRAAAPLDKMQAETMQEGSSSASKNETVYVIAGADGSVKKLIVSDWLKNASGEGKLADRSTLDGIENVKGNEGYTTSGDGIVWDAAGKDIYYQGYTEKELPVSLKISYTLNGQPVTAAELAGKSGKVTIRFDYENKQYETVEINGEPVKIYVPFAMLTGMLLDSDVFGNVEVTNGKLISDGNRMAVVGIAFPGLQENLALRAEKLEIPSYVEITADVSDFQMGNTVTVATSEIFRRIDASKLEDADALTGNLDELTAGMNALMDGSSALYNGLCTLLDKSGELIAGIEKLAAGAQALKNGSGQLKNGAYELAAGASDLSDGLQTISENSEKLSGGAKTVFCTLLATADQQLAAAGITGIPALTIQNYQTVLKGIVSSLAEEKVRAEAEKVARERVTEQVNAQRDVVKAGVTDAVRTQVEQKVTAAARENVKTQVLASMGMTPESYAAAISAGMITPEQQKAIENAVDVQMQSGAVQAAIASQIDATMASAEIAQLIETKTEEKITSLIQENMNSDAVKTQIEAAVDKAKEGAKTIQALISQLDSYNEFYEGVISYTDGVDEAAEGAGKLSEGASQIYNGSAELDRGLSELLQGIIAMKDGAPALVSGVGALQAGALQLRDGLQEFNDRGIQKLISAVDGDVAGLLTRIRATLDVAGDYDSFSGTADGVLGEVKFIYRTDAVKASN